ncbi:hypothetical protein Vretimale_18559 [Volvox reticuliferus]|uniref:Uncharacterized protein n=1 Tax=Volvox reticuliferus TaxID=1737510 RepID=A0A8J4CXV4_9CHLO|nr:hypothetical protein Vretifemale_19636 [Volvox reticuliferus]GIM15878.1 hypothetical protein Vretimale_18559 [Volvox reticuliferus]
MPCCGGHGSGHKVSAPLQISRTQGVGDAAGEALLNLSVLKTLSEHVDAATAAACHSVCRAWREAFGLSCLNSTLCTSEPVDGTRARFVANLHGAVTLEVTQPAEKAQRGFERHIAALSRNRHFLQLKVHLPVREANEQQLALGALCALKPLTQLTSLVISRNPAFTSATHNLTEEDIDALSSLRNLNFLELCTAVPPPLGLSQLARLASRDLTQLRTLAFGHTSALWRIPDVARLCQLLDVCPVLTDLRLRCCAPPRDAKQLPDLMALPLPQRLTNFALTFARRLGRGEGGGHAGGGGGGAAAAVQLLGLGGAAVEDDDEAQYGEYEDMDEPWDSVDHLAPKPGLHVLIVEKGTRITRMDINVTISVSASDLPTVSIPGLRSRQQQQRQPQCEQQKKEQRDQQRMERILAMVKERGRYNASIQDKSDGDGDDDDHDEGKGKANDSGGADDEEDVPPYDVTPLVLSEYNRLLGQELGLSGALGEPEDLHLGVRLDILEDEDDAFAAAAAAAAAAAVNHMQHMPGGAAPPLQVLAHLQAALQAVDQLHNLQLQQNQGGHGQPGGANDAMLPVLAAAAATVDGVLANGGYGPGVAMLMQQIAHLNIGGGGGNNNNTGAAAAAAAVVHGAIQQQQQHAVNQHHQNHHGGGGGGGGGRGSAAPLAARVVQLQLGPLSPHMCYLNLALVPMVTQLAMVAPEPGPNGEEVLQPPQPPADTRVAPVLLDVRGGGYTQLKSLAITGYVDQDCKPATWMSRAWLSRIPTGMPSLEYLALYDTLPSAANDPTAIEGLRSLAHMEHLELRPLYLRFSVEVPCPLSVPPPALPPKLLQLTLKKVVIPASPPAPRGAASGSSDALALLPDLPMLTHLWLFDCTAPDLMVFRRATRLEDLRMGGTTTTTRLSDLLPCFPCLRGVILDCSYSVAPGWWSAKQMSALLSLRCLRSLQIDAVSLEPQPPPRAGTSSRALTLPGSAAPTAKLRGPAATAGLAAARVPDSDDDSDAYLSTEEDSPAQLGDGVAGPNSGTTTSAAAATGANQANNAGEQQAGGVRAESRESGSGAGDDKGAAAGGSAGSDLASVLAVLSGMTQLTDLTLSFDTPTLFYDEDENDEDEENGSNEGEGSDDSHHGSVGAGGPGGAGPSTSGATSGGGAKGEDDWDTASTGVRAHTDRVFDALLSVQAFVALTALRGLWRLRLGLPHGTVWKDVTSRLLPMLKIALDKTYVEMDVL